MALTSTQLKRLRSERPNGNRLKLARQLAGLTQEDLAEKLRMSQSALSDLERSRYQATTVEIAGRFAGFYGCAIEDLFPAKREAVHS